jgi:hypothetical protein
MHGLFGLVLIIYFALGNGFSYIALLGNNFLTVVYLA